MDDQLLEQLKCPVCLEFANNAFECSLCHNIFCPDCIINKENKTIPCPICRMDPNYKEAPFARKMVNSIPSTCPNECDAKNLTLGDIHSHLLKCPERKLQCEKCNFTGKEAIFFDHAVTNHRKDNKFCSYKMMVDFRSFG